MVCRLRATFQLSYEQNMLAHKQWVLAEVLFVSFVSRVYRDAISPLHTALGDRTWIWPKITSFCGLVKSRDEGRFLLKL